MTRQWLVLVVAEEFAGEDVVGLVIEPARMVVVLSGGAGGFCVGWLLV